MSSSNQQILIEHFLSSELNTREKGGGGRKSCPLEQKIKFYTCIESLHIFIYDMTYNQYREKKSPTIF